MSTLLDGMPPPASSRLAYIDWMRGLACLVMFQTHCYHAWLNPEARKTTFFMWSQIGGTLPAPIFLFLAGISVALMATKLHGKGFPAAKISKTIVRRGAEILALGFLFRLQEFLVSWGWAPWSDLLRVDILNEIGVSIILMGLLCWVVFPDGWSLHWGVGLSAAVALAISLLSPLIWASWRPTWLPWPIQSYFDGVHNLNQPQAWLFPIFPWTAFAFAGLATGLLLFSDWAVKLGGKILLPAGFAGVGLVFLGRWLEASPYHLYAVDDFWHTSPTFYIIRVGILLAVLCFAYAWCRWGPGRWGFSPLIQLGQTSLLVYWVHIEFVYGRVSILPKGAVDIRTASFGLLIIFLAMLLLSILRTTYKKRTLAPVHKLAGANQSA